MVWPQKSMIATSQPPAITPVEAHASKESTQPLLQRSSQSRPRCPPSQVSAQASKLPRPEPPIRQPLQLIPDLSKYARNRRAKCDGMAVDRSSWSDITKGANSMPRQAPPARGRRQQLCRPCANDYVEATKSGCGLTLLVRSIDEHHLHTWASISHPKAPTSRGSGQECRPCSQHQGSYMPPRPSGTLKLPEPCRWWCCARRYIRERRGKGGRRAPPSPATTAQGRLEESGGGGGKPDPQSPSEDKVGVLTTGVWGGGGLIILLLSKTLLTARWFNAYVQVFMSSSCHFSQNNIVKHDEGGN